MFLYQTPNHITDGELNLKHAGDALIIGDSAEPRLINELKSKGSNIVASIKGQGSITYGISLTSRL
jgi:phage terminase large subunit